MDWLKTISNRLKGTFFHPQWLSDRYHYISRQRLKEIQDRRIIDIGSGNSTHNALDIESNTLYKLDYPLTQLRYGSAPDIFGDACMLPLKSESMDVALLLEVIEHIPEYKQVLDEIHRVLKPGGTLYISVPFVYPIHDAPQDFQRFTLYGIKLQLKEHHFESVVSIQHGNSFITAIQMLNLAILEIPHSQINTRPIIAYLSLIAAYPLCLLLNTLAAPLLLLPNNSRSCLGYFITARRMNTR